MNYEAILAQVAEQLLKAIVHLGYSYHKIQDLPDEIASMDEEMMETWESFAARFGRVADIFLMRYIRTIVLMGDPAFKGALRDFVNKAEKLGLITDAMLWMEIRELRNVAVHEYNDTDLSMFYKKLKSVCPHLLALKDVINKG